MKCTKCGKYLDSTMKFCPYCGFEISKNHQSFANKDISTIFEIDNLYNKKDYLKILKMAMQGNIYAKDRYIEYLSQLTQKSIMFNYAAELKTLIENCNKNPFAMCALGYFLYYFNIDRIVPDTNSIKKGYEYIKKAYDSNEVVAKTIMSDFLMTKCEYVANNVREGFVLLKECADSGYPPAIFKLGYCYYEGKYGVVQNIDLGLRLIEKAAFYNNSKAKKKLSNINSNWEEKDLCKKLYTDEFESIVQLNKPISHIDINSFSNLPIENVVINRKINNCSSINDYLKLIDEINTNTEDSKTKLISKSLSVYLSSITNLNITDDDIIQNKIKTILSKKTSDDKCDSHISDNKSIIISNNDKPLVQNSENILVDSAITNSKTDATLNESVPELVESMQSLENTAQSSTEKQYSITNEKEHKAVDKKYDIYATLSFILGVATIILVVTLVLWIVSWIASVVLGIKAIKNNTNKKITAIGGLVVDGMFLLMLIIVFIIS